MKRTDAGHEQGRMHTTDGGLVNYWRLILLEKVEQCEM